MHPVVVYDWRDGQPILSPEYAALPTLREVLEHGASQAADYSFADLPGASLSRANLADIDLTYAVLRGADFWRSRLRRAALHRADLRGANLKNADLIDANLTLAILEGCDLRGAILAGARLDGANLRSADLSGATVARASMVGANLSSADFTGVALDLVPLSLKQIRSARGISISSEGLTLYFSVPLTTMQSLLAQLAEAYAAKGNDECRTEAVELGGGSRIRLYGLPDLDLARAADRLAKLVTTASQQTIGAEQGATRADIDGLRKEISQLVRAEHSLTRRSSQALFEEMLGLLNIADRVEMELSPEAIERLNELGEERLKEIGKDIVWTWDRKAGRFIYDKGKALAWAAAGSSVGTGLYELLKTVLGG